MDVTAPSTGSPRTTSSDTSDSNWAVRALGSVATIERGKFSARPRNDPRLYGGDVPFLQTGDVSHSRGRIRTFAQTLNTEGLKVSRLFPEGTLFFTIAANIGDVGISSFAAACPDSLVAISPSDGVSIEWLLHELARRKSEFESLASPGAQLNINLEKLRPYLLLVPPTSEQRLIGEALTDADALIDSVEQLLTKKRQIKQGAMQELLTGQRRLPGFEAAWTDGVLEDVVAELVAGVSVNSDPTGASDGVPSVVKTSALKGGFFDASECKPIVQADLGRAATPLRQDTLLISRMNTPDLVGEVGYVDRAYDWLYLPDRLWMTRMRSPDCVCVRWLGYLLSSAPYKRLIGDTATGTSGSMKNIAKSALLGLPLRFPEVDEQRAIAAGLAVMDAEITALEARLTKARALKQAMAQALLTGRIRLVPGGVA